MRNILLAISLMVLFLGCKEDEAPTAISETDLLEEILTIGESESINRLSIDWVEARQRVFQAYEDASYDEAIVEFLTILNDNHSRYRPSIGEDILVRNVSCEGPDYHLSQIPSNIGYVRIDGFSGSVVEATELAEDIQRRIREQDNDQLIGWIVDLSNNTGGNMYPMIAGLGPFFKVDTLGYFIDPVGNISSWGYDQGASILNDERVIEVGDPYELIDQSNPIAVITSAATKSSGEATLIAFVGMPNARLFGSATCGLSTANRGRWLSNGDLLIITVSTMADRNRNAYGGPIVPDETIMSSSELNSRVVDWLNE